MRFDKGTAAQDDAVAKVANSAAQSFLEVATRGDRSNKQGQGVDYRDRSEGRQGGKGRRRERSDEKADGRE